MARMARSLTLGEGEWRRRPPERSMDDAKRFRACTKKKTNALVGWGPEAEPPRNGVSKKDLCADLNFEALVAALLEPCF